MPMIHFPSHLTRHVDIPAQLEIAGQTVAEVIANLGNEYPLAVGYIVDERQSLRKHVNIFIESKVIGDREKLSDVVNDSVNIYVMQALSGG